MNFSTMPKLPDGMDADYWKDLKNNFKTIKNKTNIKIQSIPIGEGSTSKAYKIFDKEKNCEMVGKIDI
jgi:hypothetical protein